MSQPPGAPRRLAALRSGHRRCRRSTLVVLCLAVILPMALSGCFQPSVAPTEVVAMTPPPTPTRLGGTLVVGLAATSIVTLDPAAYSDRTTETVLRNMFDGLVTRTVDNEIVPELAEEYRWVDDLTVEFTLRQGVKFHNGEALTADDVVYTFERILHQDIGAQRRGFVQEVDRVVKVDDTTVRFVLKSPWPVFLQMLVHNQIVPQDYLAWVGDERFAARPWGSGPFRYVEGDLNDRIVLERFADYYGGADAMPPVGPARLQRVIFRLMPDATDRVEALLSGDVHIIQSVPPSMVALLTDNPAVTVKAVTSTQPKFMDLNVTVPPFDDVRVRRALNHAVDKERLLDDVAGGYGLVLAGPLSPANEYVDPSLQPYDYNPMKAIELLAEAGYSSSDIVFQIDAYGPYVEIAEDVAAQLRELGMDVGVTTWDYQEVRPLLLACQRQAFLRDWGDSAFDPVGYVEAKWQTYVPGTAAGRANYSCYSNPHVDYLITEGASEPYPDFRHEIYDELQRIIYDDAPAVFLYVPQEIAAASARVRNWQPSPDGRINLHDVWLED
jgi:peptide/nickel transport system substrate-binding protein